MLNPVPYFDKINLYMYMPVVLSFLKGNGRHCYLDCCKMNPTSPVDKIC